MKSLRISLIVSNLLCFCLGVLLFLFVLLLGAYDPSSSSKIGRWMSGTLWLSVTNLVALRYLFNRLKPGLLKSIFTGINAFNAVCYTIGFFGINMILNRYGARLSFGPEYAIAVKALILLPGFLALVSAFNFLVMAGYINIHKKNDENPLPTGEIERQQELLIGNDGGATIKDIPSADLGKTNPTLRAEPEMIQEFKKNKRYALFALCLAALAAFFAFRFLGGEQNPLGWETTDSKITFEWLIEPKLSGANNFSCGVAWIQENEGDPWMLIDSTGKVLVRGFKAKSISPYDEETGLAFFEKSDGWEGNEFVGNRLAGYINLSGDVVVEPGYSFSRGFKYGMAVVTKKIDGRFFQGVIDRHGKIVLPFIYTYEGIDSLEIITPELIAIRKDDMWGCVNRKGEVVIDFISDTRPAIKEEFISYPSPLFFHSNETENSFSYVLPPNVLSINIKGKEGLIDVQGKWILSADYDRVFNGEGHFLSGIENRWASPFAYESAFGGGKGLIGLEKDGKVGFVNAEGKTVIDFKFYGTSIVGTDEAKKPLLRRLNGPLYTFSEGLAVVLLSPIPAPPAKIPYKTLSFGVIDMKGNVLFSFQGGGGEAFKDGFMRVWGSDNALSLIDRSGDRYHKYLPLPLNRKTSQRLLKVIWDSPSRGIGMVAEKDSFKSRPKWGYLRFKINQGGN